ncbi:variable surface lipoprotein [Mycoplasmopsis verecunda]|uniref:Lipoprotein n=1 Tax=Mycoplasmopsis verecunda TaxID=171291 RepID=A0A1T4KLM6_9BACT|nr:variable surface lipoprotein [Mycoplasmopsis verecunda]WPB54286.1 variable surface lipoprotein [Mycoplasmopsis verecunda]SJZ43301.1 hypothetical protein SAMN02745154_00103 [Mycoplasmopsis verecunda]
MKRWKFLLTLGTIGTATLPIVAASCGGGNKTQESKPQDPITTPTPVVKSVKKSIPASTLTPAIKTLKHNVTIASIGDLNKAVNNYNADVAKFENDQTYNNLKLVYNINLGDFKFNDTILYTREQFGKLKDKLDKTKIDTNVDLGVLTLDANNQEELKKAEEVIQHAFNNYYVNANWFESTLKDKFKAAGASTLTGSVTLEKAIKNGKQAEYNSLVNEIKKFMLDNANLKLADDLKITKLDQNIHKGWSLNLTLQKGDLKAKGVKLDFKKPKADWSDKQILEENLKGSKFEKVKQSVSQKVFNYKEFIYAMSPKGAEIVKPLSNTLIALSVVLLFKQLPFPLSTIAVVTMAKPIVKYLTEVSNKYIETFFQNTQK